MTSSPEKETLSYWPSARTKFDIARCSAEGRYFSCKEARKGNLVSRLIHTESFLRSVVYGVGYFFTLEKTQRRLHLRSRLIHGATIAGR